MARLRRRVEQGLVGEIGDRVEARYRGHERRGAGSDDEASRGDAGAAHLQETWRDKLGFTELDVDAEAAEPLDRIVRLDRCDSPPHVVVSGGEIVAPRRSGQQCLGGDAARVQALPAHPGLLDQDHRGAHLDRACCERKPRRSGPDHAEIGFDPVAHSLRPDYLSCSHAPPLGLLPIGDRVAPVFVCPPAAACRLQRRRIGPVEHVEAAFEAAGIGRGNTIDHDGDLSAIGIGVVGAKKDRLARGLAVSRRAVRQERALIVGPERRVQRLRALLGAGEHHGAAAALQHLLQ